MRKFAKNTSTSKKLPNLSRHQTLVVLFRFYLPLMSTDQPRKVRSDVPFFSGLLGFAVLYLLLILSIILANASFITIPDIQAAMTSEAIQSSLKLTFLTCTISAILSLLFAIPIGYSMSRFHFKGRTLLDTLLDIPIILPPLVIGLSLLIFFNNKLMIFIL